jgi:adenylate kinase
MRVVLIGPPGAGKGTQAVFIAERFSIPHIATGDIFRANISGGTPLGELARTFIEAGDLVPDQLTGGMVRDRLNDPDAQHGFLLDGFPRNVAQAYELDAMLNDLGSSLDVVLLLAIDDHHILSRLIARRYQQHRADDQTQTVRHRLDVYAEQTAPLLTFYESRRQLVTIDALGAIESVATRAIDALASLDRSADALDDLDAAM